MPRLRLERVAFAHRDAVPILQDASAVFPVGWTGLVGENGAGKTTLLRLLAGRLQPQQGRVWHEPPALSVVLCEQEVDQLDPDVRLLAERQDGDAHRLRGELRLDPDGLARWSTLSPGERKRWQIGAALVQPPDALLLDEPTNNLDGAGRELLLAALRRFRGVGLLVSHDRALLEALTVRTARLREGVLRVDSGAYSEARALWEAERERDRTLRTAAQAEARQAARRLADARRDRAAAEAALSGRRRDRHDRDARSVTAKTLRSWAEDRLGGQVHRLRTAAERAEAAVPAAGSAEELGRSVFLGFSRAPKPVLLALDADEIHAGDTHLLADVHLVLRREDRIRLEGCNGAGKTSLLRALLETNADRSGGIFYLPQDVPPEQGARILASARTLSAERRGRILSLVAALGTDPDRLLASAAPSPGESRKLLLADGLAAHPGGVVLDEPTNHLDLPSVERLGTALAAYPGAILLVTHDDALADTCTTTRWRIDGDQVLVR